MPSPTQQLERAVATETMLGVFRPRTVGGIIWLFYDRLAVSLSPRLPGGSTATVGPDQVAGSTHKATGTTVGKIGLMFADGAAYIEQIEIYQQHRGRKVRMRVVWNIESSLPVKVRVFRTCLRVCMHS
jgi:hypothetical protein